MEEMDFGTAVLVLRRNAHLTQREVADRIPGTSARYISVIEQGRKRPGPRLVVSLARALDCDLAYLLWLSKCLPDEILALIPPSLPPDPIAALLPPPGDVAESG